MSDNLMLEDMLSLYKVMALNAARPDLLPLIGRIRTAYQAISPDCVCGARDNLLASAECRCPDHGGADKMTDAEQIATVAMINVFTIKFMASIGQDLSELKKAIVGSCDVTIDFFDAKKDGRI